ncbi:MAG: hypothetical protein A3H39_17360 [candidate division NC10 bacterium RIFCSPLOWO2_02_FULL_66_22]|nr:MAG: hypothetical protein A3H39_17360 [candidate division NC10 bacterium RIFCSPLOWO2_02_FULL_66_22]
MLAIGRGLMSKPKLLMLDEPPLGLAPLLVGDLKRAIRRICDVEASVLLVEPNAKMALEIADRAYLLQLGLIRAEGPVSEIRTGDYIREAYLG